MQRKSELLLRTRPAASALAARLSAASTPQDSKRMPPLANLWMLKASNGMLWYAVDYLRRFEGPIHVIVRPHLANLLRRELAASAMVRIESVGPAGFLRRVLAAVGRSRLIYTPTPHPIPYASRQIVVFHDAFPFEGPRGSWKRQLFRFGIASSHCVVAYINHSVARPWLLEAGVSDDRLLFAPNIPPMVADDATPAPMRVTQKDLRRIGAFGTDSPKKRYSDLLAELAREPYRDRLELCIYGEVNAYARSLMRDFARHPPTLIDPNTTSLRDFVQGMDAIVSVAPGEGFGRPIATAIMLGVPCCLIESPTFREFFAGLAWLEPDIPRILDRILTVGIQDAPLREVGFLAPAYARAIDDAVARIGRMA